MSLLRLRSLVRFSLVIGLLAAGGLRAGAALRIETPANPSPRVTFGAERLREALTEAGADEAAIVLGRRTDVHVRALPDATGLPPTRDLEPESYLLASLDDGRTVVVGADDSGLLYGCLDLADRVREARGLPAGLRITSGPALKLRGAAIGMQKTYILPGRKVYEYPYTPELFPFFYDKAFWREYLDRLVELRMNTLYLWNGHPFASLVKLEDYPYALEVSEEVFARNSEMMHFITEEADKRGIWLVQMFYNIILSKPFAERHGLSTQLDAIHPLAADYTRKSIAEFVRRYPNVGLLVCLGEALQDISQQSQWCNEVILAGVKDGMRLAGLTEEPPVVIRAHATDESVIIPSALEVYRNLYTMAKYNGESLTTWEPRGVWQQRHLAMSRLGSTHVVNVHILANLEPFRYGAPRFIQRSVQAMQERLGAGGLHLYPLTYWNWPYSPDLVDGQPNRITQLERDWIWFEAWARYAWRPDRAAESERGYWTGRLAERYGSPEAGALLLDAYNDAGECAPRILRRFGITEGNRQTMALGMTLEQLVDPAKARPYPELWLSQAPPGERLQEYVEREWHGEPHVGETPPQLVAEVLEFSARAVAAVDAAAAHVTRNRDEYERLRNDVHCIRALSLFYAEKARAAERVLRHRLSGNAGDLAAAGRHLAASVEHFRELARRTDDTYAFANSMQTSMRRVPIRGAVDERPANFHWRDLLPVYERELEEFRARLSGANGDVSRTAAAPVRLRPVPVRVTGGETFALQEGERVFRDASATITGLAPALRGLNAVRVPAAVAGEAGAAPVEFVADEPVRVLIGFVRDVGPEWRRPPELETDALAGERGGVEPILTGAVTLDGGRIADVHAFRYPAGRNRLELRGRGRYLILGFVAVESKE